MVFGCCSFGTVHLCLQVSLVVDFGSSVVARTATVSSGLRSDPGRRVAEVSGSHRRLISMREVVQPHIRVHSFSTSS